MATVEVVAATAALVEKAKIEEAVEVQHQEANPEVAAEAETETEGETDTEGAEEAKPTEKEAKVVGDVEETAVEKKSAEVSSKVAPEPVEGDNMVAEEEKLETTKLETCVDSDVAVTEKPDTDDVEVEVVEEEEKDDEEEEKKKKKKTDE